MSGKRRSPDQSTKRNGKLRIPLPFEEAVKAGLETKPPEKPERKSRKKKPAKS